MKSASELMRASIPVWVALTWAVIHPAAQAETRLDNKRMVTSVRVDYADLDLAHPADAQALAGRIKDAAYRACGGDPRRHAAYTMMPVRVEMVFKECRDDAVARAMATVASASLASST